MVSYMDTAVRHYIQVQADDHRKLCERLYREISNGLPQAENKLWHAHPVWFLDSNPTVGFSVQKLGVRLMFWSGADFDEPELKPGAGKFKDASIFYSSVDQLDLASLHRWLEKSQKIQWDY